MTDMGIFWVQYEANLKALDGNRPPARAAARCGKAPRCCKAGGSRHRRVTS